MTTRRGAVDVGADGIALSLLTANDGGASDVAVVGQAYHSCAECGYHFRKVYKIMNEWNE